MTGIVYPFPRPRNEGMVPGMYIDMPEELTADEAVGEAARLAEALEIQILFLYRDIPCCLNPFADQALRAEIDRSIEQYNGFGWPPSAVGHGN